MSFLQVHASGPYQAGHVVTSFVSSFLDFPLMGVPKFTYQVTLTRFRSLQADLSRDLGGGARGSGNITEGGRGER